MKKCNRIKANEDFAIAIKKGKTFKRPSFTIHCLKNELKFVRIGISVSKKVGNAVTRNRIKRQIRSMCDSVIRYSEHGFDIVIVARDSFLNHTFLENSETLHDVFNEIGLNNEEKI